MAVPSGSSGKPPAWPPLLPLVLRRRRSNTQQTHYLRSATVHDSKPRSSPAATEEDIPSPITRKPCRRARSRPSLGNFWRSSGYIPRPLQVSDRGSLRLISLCLLHRNTNADAASDRPGEREGATSSILSAHPALHH